MTPTQARALLGWNWKKLVRIVPELANLERVAIEYHDARCDPADRQVILAMLRRLAGLTAEKPELRAQEPFDVAREHLLRCWQTGKAEATQ